MELNRKHFPANIFYNFRGGLTQQQCIDELNSIIGGEAPTRTSVYWWYGEFSQGHSSLQDEFRECRPKSVVVPESIDVVRQLILQDRHVTYRETATTLGIGGTSIHSILHEHLTVKKIFRVRSHTICQSVKKGLVSIGRKKCSKNTIEMLRNTSIASWQVTNSGFMRMSQKISSSQVYGCFKMNKIQ